MLSTYSSMRSRNRSPRTYKGVREARLKKHAFGVHVSYQPRKQALVSLLREADKNSSNDHETGKGDASGMVTGNLEQSSEGAPLNVVETDTLSMESPV